MANKRPMENHEIVCAADELYRGLIATYIDIAGQRKAVNGELSKLKHVPTLSAAARTILANAKARSRKHPWDARGAKDHAQADACQQGLLWHVPSS